MQDEDRPLEEDEIDQWVETPMIVQLAKSHVMSIRLSGDELRLLAVRARDANLPVSTFIRDAAIAAASAPTRLASRAEIKFGLSAEGLALGAYAPQPSAGGVPSYVQWGIQSDEPARHSQQTA